jgi:hypothetical protein
MRSPGESDNAPASETVVSSVVWPFCGPSSGFTSATRSSAKQTAAGEILRPLGDSAVGADRPQLAVGCQPPVRPKHDQTHDRRHNERDDDRAQRVNDQRTLKGKRRPRSGRQKLASGRSELPSRSPTPTMPPTWLDGTIDATFRGAKARRPSDALRSLGANRFETRGARNARCRAPKSIRAARSPPGSRA